VEKEHLQGDWTKKTRASYDKEKVQTVMLYRKKKGFSDSGRCGMKKKSVRGQDMGCYYYY
jgi:hypothetical protein